jgi:hypothetical protein
MLYLGILCNFMSIFLVFALSKINYARTLLITVYRSPQKSSGVPSYNQETAIAIDRHLL